VEWNEANSLARLALGFSDFDYDEVGGLTYAEPDGADPFEEANDDLNSRIYAEHREARSV
jgi:hypothetical protein